MTNHVNNASGFKVACQEAVIMNRLTSCRTNCLTVVFNKKIPSYNYCINFFSKAETWKIKIFIHFSRFLRKKLHNWYRNDRKARSPMIESYYCSPVIKYNSFPVFIVRRFIARGDAILAFPVFRLMNAHFQFFFNKRRRHLAGMTFHR